MRISGIIIALLILITAAVSGCLSGKQPLTENPAAGVDDALVRETGAIGEIAFGSALEWRAPNAGQRARSRFIDEDVGALQPERLPEPLAQQG